MNRGSSGHPSFEPPRCCTPALWLWLLRDHLDNGKKRTRWTLPGRRCRASLSPECTVRQSRSCADCRVSPRTMSCHSTIRRTELRDENILASGERACRLWALRSPIKLREALKILPKDFSFSFRVRLSKSRIQETAQSVHISWGQSVPNTTLSMPTESMMYRRASSLCVIVSYQKLSSICWGVEKDALAPRSALAILCSCVRCQSKCSFSRGTGRLAGRGRRP